MSIDFRNIAIESTTLSTIMDGRTRLSMDDVISSYPNGVTVDGFDIIHDSKNGDYSVVTFAEDSNKFFFGGKVLTNIVHGWISVFEGDIEKASIALKDSGGVKMQFSHGRTKNGNNLTTVKII